MADTLQSPAGAPAASSSEYRARYEMAFESMLTARHLEEKLASLYRGGKIHGGVFISRGQEALSAALGHALQKGDVFAPLIRDQAARIAFGESIFDAIRTYLGSPLGPMRSRDGNVHRGRPRDGVLPMISHLGSMISVVCGCLVARRFAGRTGHVGATCIGDGATSTGSFHEGLNLAAVEKLPLVLIVANNQYAYSTPNSRQFACADLIDKAAGYGVEACKTDGTDLNNCLKVVGGAVERARSGQGPQLVLASLLRLSGHGEHDDAGYVDPELKRSALGRDCVKVCEAFLLLQEWATPESLGQLHARLADRINEAVLTVQREKGPDPYTEDWCALATRHLSEGFVQP